VGKLAIIGLGLIGGSMGLAIKRAEPVNTEVTGYDRDFEVAERALKFGAVQKLARSAEEAVSDAAMVIVATPILNIRRVFETIAPHLRQGTVVTDTASTKGEVLRWARALLPENVHFIGGHPMAGKEKSGPEAAEESLFDGRPYVIVPNPYAAPGAVNAVIGLAQAVGGKPQFMDADEHDAYAAAISHVPLVTSLALFSLARQSTAWPELAAMSGPGFKDLTRLASGEPEMSHDIFMTNKDNVVHWLDRYVAELQRLSQLIQDGDPETLYRQLAETQMERDIFITSPPERKEHGDDTETPGAIDSFMTMLGGALWTNRAKEITDSLEEQRLQREREARMRRRPED
jgi:prephenate dehydrogenase